jgi:predicted PurR-regulated permease PerM
MRKDSRNITVTITSGTIVKTILFLLLVGAIYFFWDLVLVVLTAIVIASSVEPAARWFKKIKVPRLPAVLIVYIGAVAFLAGMFYFFVPPVLEDAAGFLNALPGYLDSSDFLGPVSEKGPSILKPGIKELSETLSLSEVVNNLRTAIEGISESFLKIVSAVFGGLMSLVLIVVLSFYLAVQEDGIGNFLRIITPVKHEKYVIDLWRRSQFKIGRWMQGQLVLALIIGVLVYLGLTILGMKYALLLAVLAAVFELIPIFGPILAAIPAIIISFVDGGVAAALLIVGLYIIIQQFENQLIYPLVVRKVVGVPPLLVILALVIGARVAGFLGIILSVPIAAAFREYVSDVQKGKMEEEKRLASRE